MGDQLKITKQSIQDFMIYKKFTISNIKIFGVCKLSSYFQLKQTNLNDLYFLTLLRVFSRDMYFLKR